MGLGDLWRLLRGGSGAAGRGADPAGPAARWPTAPAPATTSPPAGNGGRSAVADRSGAAVRSSAAVPGTPSPGPDSTPPTPEAQARPHLAWLLALPPGPAASQARIDALLRGLDAALAREAAAGRLLRRAPNLVPRLVNALRNEAWNRREVVEQIQRDAVLTAETLRLARSALYGRQAEGGDVAQAVDLLGAQGLKQVIARVLVRPLFQADGDSPAARAAPRIWEESDRCARLCVALMREGGEPAVDGVDACLAGLLHTVGWNVLLQLTGPAGAMLALDQGLLEVPGVAEALALRRDRILARLLPGWNLSPLLTAWGASLPAEAGSQSAGPAVSPGTPLATLKAQLARAEALVVRRRVAELAGQVPEPPPGLAGAVVQVWLED